MEDKTAKYIFVSAICVLIFLAIVIVSGTIYDDISQEKACKELGFNKHKRSNSLDYCIGNGVLQPVFMDCNDLLPFQKCIAEKITMECR